MGEARAKRQAEEERRQRERGARRAAAHRGFRPVEVVLKSSAVGDVDTVVTTRYQLHADGSVYQVDVRRGSRRVLDVKVIEQVMEGARERYGRSVVAPGVKGARA